MPEAEWDVSSEVCSATSYSELARDAREAERRNRLNPLDEPVVSHLAARLPGAAVIVAASDYVRAYPHMIAAYLEARFTALGADGFGRSDTRPALRAFFEIDRCSVVIAALASLAKEGLIAREVVADAIKCYGVNSSAPPPTQVNTYWVVEEVLPSLQGDPATLDKLYIRSLTTGQMVPLSAFAKWTTNPVAPLSISHQGQFPATTISFNLANGVALGQATTAVQQAVQQLQLPPSLTTTFQGNAQAFQESLTTVPLLILAALVCVYIILGILYESFIHPLTILSTLPSAGVGALATLMLFGYEFSLVALIGLILLIGIVKKNGIMMVDFAISAEREEGKSTVEAIREAALLRFRPIMMTTMAALLGAVPLMLSHGSGSEMRQPLGFTMFGGLIFSQALTLFTTPIIYLYLDRVSHWLSRGSGKTQPPTPKKPIDIPPGERDSRLKPVWVEGRVRAVERPTRGLHDVKLR
jgi:hypothetical protein